MTRTDVMASSRPRTAGAAPIRNGSRAMRWLTVLPIVLILGMALLVPTSALAASETSGYGSTTPTPTTGTEPNKETEPAKETTEPTTTPTTTTEPAKTLPFTGFDLRWSFAVGLLLMGAGFSIVVVQRRQRRDGGR